MRRRRKERKRERKRESQRGIERETHTSQRATTSDVASRMPDLYMSFSAKEPYN